MLDYRIYTFLSLCETLNYTQTALDRGMTQPGVTQHIHLLEKEYDCKLFEYAGRSLKLTKAGKLLEAHLRSAVSAENASKLKIATPETVPLRVGATKTIGDYVIRETISRLAADDGYQLELYVDNTDVILKKLDEFEIDIALIEGFFDKSRYSYKPLRRERFIGICSKDHPFVGQKVTMRELLKEHVILREEGSGTRSIFEAMLQAGSYTTEAFAKRTVSSSFTVIRDLVASGVGISFVYETIAQRDPRLATFAIRGRQIYGEFNYVYLPGTEENPWFLKALK